MKKNKVLLVILPVLLATLLASCGTTQSTDSNSIAPTPQTNVGNPQNGANPEDNGQGQRGPGMPGGRGADRFGSGAQRFGSGSQRFGSGAMTKILDSLSTEDKAVFGQMQDARKAGNTDLVNQLRAQLQKKYPNLKFGGGRGFGSGSPSVNSGSVNPISPNSVPPSPPAQ